MKILVCTDGSDHSQKALEKAAFIATCCRADQVAVIHVCESRQDTSHIMYTATTYEEQAAEFKKAVKEHREKEAREIFKKALTVFSHTNIAVKTIFEQGHPAKIILDVASEGGFDMIFIGSRGLGGWRKRILGSVSGAVVQEAKDITIVVVK